MNIVSICKAHNRTDGTNIMADKPIQTPAGTEKTPTPKGTEGENTPKNPVSRDEGPKSPEIDYKKKFSESKEEALRIRAEKAELEAKLGEAQRALFEKELREDNPDFDLLSDTEKAEIKRRKQLEKDVAEMKAKDKMREDYAKISATLKAKIEKLGGYEAFRDYVCHPDRIGVKDITSLAQAFTYDIKDESASPAVELSKPGLESGSGGQPTAPSKTGFTKDEVAHIRTTDPKRYAQLCREGKMKIVD